MGFESTFTDIELAQLPGCVQQAKALGWRFVQLLATNTDNGIDLSYSFVHDGLLDTYRIRGIEKGTKIPSITGEFLSAFVFENEAHDLFGVEIENIAIDFQGNFYRLAVKEPMTIVTPEKLAECEKAKKLAAAKAAAAAKKAAEQGEGAAPAAAPAVAPAAAPAAEQPEAAPVIEQPAAAPAADTPAAPAVEQPAAAPAADTPAAEPVIEQPAGTLSPEIEAKFAKMDPEKAAKARAALLAKAAKEAGNE